MKRIFSIFLAFSILLACSVFTDISAASNIQLNRDEVTLYVISDDDKDILSFREGLSDTFKLEVLNAYDDVGWRVVSGDSVKVDNNGLLSVRYTLWYCGSYYSSTQPFDGYTYTRLEPEYGESVVEATVGDIKLRATVTVTDYAVYHAENILNEYYKNNINDSMSDYEKLETICRFPAQYNYDYHYYDYVSMIVHGGGDCWASTSAINYLCRLAGFNFHTRYAALDPGAGSGHRNTAVILDDGVYILEAGFYEEAPRYYTVYKLTDGYSYSYLGDETAEIYLYDGNDPYLNIPESINGNKVVSLGDNFIYYNENASDYRVKEVRIPATVTNISTLAFAGCEELGAICVSKDNSYFDSVDGVLFTKDHKKLYAFPSAKTEEYTVPSEVEEIGEYAFYFSDTIKKVTIGDEVTEIGFGAFGNCKNLESIEIPESLTVISDYAFYNTPQLNMIKIPESVTVIEEKAFNNSFLTIIGKAGSAAEVYALEHGLKFIDEDMALLYGDADGNGRVNIADATTVQKHSAGLLKLDEAAIISADVNGDGNVNVIDATLIQKLLASIIVAFPVEV